MALVRGPTVLLGATARCLDNMNKHGYKWSEGLGTRGLGVAVQRMDAVEVVRRLLGGRTDGIRGDIKRLLSPQGSPRGETFTLLQALQRVTTRPGPTAIALYRASHRLWLAGHEAIAEMLWRLGYSSLARISILPRR